MNVKSLAELRGLWLLTTPTALNLTSVEVLQNTVKTDGVESMGGGGAREKRRGQNRVQGM